MKKFSFVLVFALALWWFGSCTSGESPDSPRQKKQHNTSAEDTKEKPEIAKISILPDELTYTTGDKLTIRIEPVDSTASDSLRLFAGGQLLISQSVALPFSFEWDSEKARTGRNKIRAEIFSGGKMNIVEKQVIFLSDIEPEKYSYQLVGTYPHDKQAYTQGLFFHKGFLYESTGLNGGSTLRKVDIESGDILQSYTIRDDYFCEGITLYKDRIVQLTWRANVGFVYNLEDFSLIEKFNYPTEGWGITTVGDSLVMSDGSATLYVLDPQTFMEIDRIEVYDNKTPVGELNELEYIEGEIFANVYGSQQIMRIDPQTGKVLGKIDCTNILPPAERHPKTDVMNGIAYNPESKHLFITGKNWPKLYEIKVK